MGHKRLLTRYSNTWVFESHTTIIVSTHRLIQHFDTSLKIGMIKLNFNILKSNSIIIRFIFTEPTECKQYLIINASFCYKKKSNQNSYNSFLTLCLIYCIDILENKINHLAFRRLDLDLLFCYKSFAFLSY